MTLTWVPFRAKDFAAALGLLGAPLRDPGADRRRPALLPACSRCPYLLLTFLVAAAVVWGAPQTWTWTRELTLARVRRSLALFALAVAALATQEFNPFIYFIF